MELEKLLTSVDVLSNNAEQVLEIDDISINSEKAKEGDMFICLKGKKADGHDFISSLKGKVAVFIVEKKPNEDVPYILVADTRKAYSVISQNFFRNPADSLRLISVVGTNGKTSTAHIINDILTYAGFKTGLIGTLGHYILNEKVSESLTTPDPYELNKLFFEMLCKGVEVVTMEVSAHAIALQKLYGLKFDISILTNITQDHLDYFETFEKYAETKLSFFTEEHTKLAVINVDDEWGQKLSARAEIPTVTYALESPCDVFAIDVFPDIDGTKFVVNLFDNVIEMKSSLYGYFNVYNLLSAMIVASSFGVSTDTICQAVRRIKPIDGRFNILKNNKGMIVIDYAHTPDGLKNLLSTARSITKSRLITVFGCGGERDRTKRSIMGAIASKMSELVVLTSDNPRGEEPESIIAEIEQGVIGCEKKVLPHRGDAISYAISEMQEGDTVVIAGKGAENYMEIRGQKIPFSDLEQALKRGARR
ncbi:MAG TPA: UDP-N-acetylmuramoyl-L-alanyl-D-glutamate--2,6-diaminopimelate ligase [Clostridia bacterium]|nr:UDP-N-acetylmuramoyl-L-alanyl-D-glutamate--2,6-diaminopimelate ligase [Clostridia bacterium]